VSEKSEHRNPGAQKLRIRIVDNPLDVLIKIFKQMLKLGYIKQKFKLYIH